MGDGKQRIEMGNENRGQRGWEMKIEDREDGQWKVEDSRVLGWKMEDKSEIEWKMKDIMEVDGKWSIEGKWERKMGGGDIQR